jgi:hypothetical protein
MFDELITLLILQQILNKSIILSSLAISAVPSQLRPKKITLAESQYLITTKYLHSYQIILLHEAWYKVRRLATFVKIDRDSWHSLSSNNPHHFGWVSRGHTIQNSDRRLLLPTVAL